MIKKKHLIFQLCVSLKSIKNVLLIFSGDFFWQTDCAFGIMANCWQSLSHASKHGGAFSIYRARLFPSGAATDNRRWEEELWLVSGYQRPDRCICGANVSTERVGKKKTSEKLKIFNNADGKQPLLVDPFNSALFPLVPFPVFVLTDTLLPAVIARAGNLSECRMSLRCS